MLLLILLLIGAIVFTVITIKSNDYADYALGNFLVQTFSAVAVVCCIIGFIIVLSNTLYSEQYQLFNTKNKKTKYGIFEYWFPSRN